MSLINYLWEKEVINAGCAGYGTDNELLFFQNEGYKYNPDITILCIFPWNDIRNNSNALEEIFFERSKFPHFEIGQNGELVLKKENFSNEYEPLRTEFERWPTTASYFWSAGTLIRRNKRR